jgi:hypothetical protein
VVVGAVFVGPEVIIGAVAPEFPLMLLPELIPDGIATDAFD